MFLKNYMEFFSQIFLINDLYVVEESLNKNKFSLKIKYMNQQECRAQLLAQVKNNNQIKEAYRKLNKLKQRLIVEQIIRNFINHKPEDQIETENESTSDEQQTLQIQTNNPQMLLLNQMFNVISDLKQSLRKKQQICKYKIQETCLILSKSSKGITKSKQPK
ncbi:hypothetical protein pb186bvf_011784 [Paramecium bursaria]